MKRLWKHIAECKDQKCLVPHCVSSRYVLSHYHRCKDVRCPVCGPVREAIHRSHEKQKQMQALKQRHQQALASSGTTTQPTQAPLGAAPGIGDAATKRRKTNAGVPVPSYAASQQRPAVPGQAYSLSQKAPGIPTQPHSPNVKAGYVYSQPQAGGAVARPGQPHAPAVPGLAYSNGQVIMPKHSGPKPQEDHTLINCFTIEQIETHIASLNKGLQLAPQILKTKCLDVLKVLQSHQHAWVFNSPVDPVELGLPDYFEVIKRPMDLGTIKKRLENGCYHSLEDFEEHVHTTFDNAMLYNPEGSVVYNMAKEMKEKFVVDYAKLIERLNAEEDAKRKNGDSCVLCGCEKLQFEPPVFYCNGPNCPSKRIRRNSYYFVSSNSQYHWCHQCFADLRDNQLIELGDVTLKKESLTKKKNDEVHEESWVQCDKCERWVHQICALFNTRQNKDHRSEYKCPRCTIDDRKRKGQTEGSSTTPMAEDLPRTKLSERLEKHVRTKVDEFFQAAAKEKAEKENISAEEAKKGLSMGGEITIRQVTSMDRKLEVRERMKKRYAFKNYPEEFTYRCKCIVVFQNLDGVDVILFGLYVYEHDEKNPAPNTRTVYISYLDSVHYMRPRNMRTLIYHEILISYLDYVREKNFLTAHIWACPPLKGDDYILYAKPEDQKTPKDDRLRQWYVDMLVECQNRGIVGKVSNMFDVYFSNEKNDASVVPYMEGDYFSGEAENIIKDIEEGKHGKKANPSGKKKKNSSKAKKKSGRGGTRSTGLDEEALAASGFLPAGTSQKSLEEGGRDFVMAKLGETIQPMKESFLVAYLASEVQSKENLVVPKEIEEYRAKVAAEKGTSEGSSKENAADPAKTASTEPASETAASPAAQDEKSADVIMSDAQSAPTENGPKTPAENDTAQPAPNGVKTEPASNDDSPAGEAPAPTSSEPAVKEESQGSKPEEEQAGPDKVTPAADAGPDTKETPAVDAKSKASAPANESKPAADSTKAEDTSSPEAAVVVSPASNPDEVNKSEASTVVDGPSQDSDAKPATAADSTTNEKPDGDSTAKADNTGGAGGEKPANAASPSSAATKPTQENQDGDDKKDDSAGVKPAEGGEGGDEKKDDSADATPTTGAKGGDDEKKEDSSKEPSTQKANTSIREGKFAAMAARKRTLEGNTKDESSSEKKSASEDPPTRITVKDSKGRLVKVIDDDMEEMDCEFLNNRQAFLNLCQGNHYQYDYLRRAKHSSMMVLWHLHNRDAPKFVQQCAICSREILTGYRYHCPTCADYDQCHECVSNPNSPRHPHQLKAIPVASGQQSELTEAQRKERQRSIQLHMTLLLHAATCKSSKCPSANCTKMKGLLKHGSQCQVKATGGCHVCKRIWALLQLHARQCKESACPVPNCMAIRERFRQLKKQQQAMDDRRREEMNRHYRGMAR